MNAADVTRTGYAHLFAEVGEEALVAVVFVELAVDHDHLCAVADQTELRLFLRLVHERVQALFNDTIDCKNMRIKNRFCNSGLLTK